MQISNYPVITTIGNDDLLLVQTANDNAYKSISKGNLQSNITLNSTESFIQILDQRTSGTQGGTATQNAWTVHPLNTIKKDDTGVVTVSSDTFVLPAGTYVIDAKAAFYDLFNTKLRLQNTTDNATVFYGLVSSFNASGGAVGTAHLSGKFTITASKSFQLQYFTVSGGTSSQYNLGGSVGDGSPEIYAVIDLRKVG